MKMLEHELRHDLEDDGRGSAPVLQRGTAYRLRVVASPDIDEQADELVRTVLAVDPP